MNSFKDEGEGQSKLEKWVCKRKSEKFIGRYILKKLRKYKFLKHHEWDEIYEGKKLVC